ncbi:hypothetical protein F4779DRAFT_619980 [Xylariaceae sp. FL0662B]|nr:hypothetical protein F4779DRAFT_619980 [Xylariaceae sp. FL0662B]
MADSEASPIYTLYVYVTRYSSGIVDKSSQPTGWGARVALVLAYFRIPHKLEMFTLDQPPLLPQLRGSGSLLPVLQPDPGDPDFTIADSLAICEFLAERRPELWPRDPRLRALARSAAAQMHAGFGEIRNTYHSNFLGRYTGEIPVSEGAAREIRQLVELWSMARARTRARLAELGEEDEGFLFGAFSVADAFFWPVVWRFRSFQLPLTGISEDGLKWMAKMWNDPVMKAQGREYFRQAQDPLTKVEKYEDIFRGNPNVKYSQFTEDWTFETPKA